MTNEIAFPERHRPFRTIRSGRSAALSLEDVSAQNIRLAESLCGMPRSPIVWAEVRDAYAERGLPAPPFTTDAQTLQDWMHDLPAIARAVKAWNGEPEPREFDAPACGRTTEKE